MTVQTIPPIDEMTPAQQIELMEALWKSMGENRRNIEPPDWHRKYLEEREKAIVAGTDEFIDIGNLKQTCAGPCDEDHCTSLGT